MTHAELESAVRELQDRQAIHDCLMTYSRGIDRLDRELLLSVYHEDAVDDHGVFVGTREQFVDWVIPMHAAAQLSHQHCILNYTIELDGDVAHTEAYYLFVAMNRQGRPLTTARVAAAIWIGSRSATDAGRSRPEFASATGHRWRRLPKCSTRRR
jgi:hypothetical protein